ncbi:MAG TPA: SpoIIE family protein phosphatase [Terracidiphilus sp.]|nr:SpoIIE family protein phosphatase [Terracidiphilus sp.]
MIRAWRTATQVLTTGILSLVALAGAFTAAAQPAPQTSPPAPAPTPTLLTLDGPWHFQIGDDPQWASPTFDDSTWATVSLSKSLTDQNFAAYSGFAWYRLQLTPAQLAIIAGQPAAIMVTPDSVGQAALYINGVEVNQTRGMGSLTMYRSPPFTAALPTSGTVVLAIRTWAGEGVDIRRGLITSVEAGTSPLIGERLALASDRIWDESALAPIGLTFLFLCVAGLGGALYIAQRHHLEYLWLCFLGLSVALDGVAEVVFGLSAVSYGAYSIFANFAGRVFLAITLEFTLLFTASKAKRLVRSVQIAALLLPFLSFIPFHAIYQFFSVALEVVVCAVLCGLLYQAWRGGRRDAAVMLPTFFLAATADSIGTLLDYLAGLHVLPESFAIHSFRIGPVVFGTNDISFAIFLVSLILVILYRFIRVSQDEQRSSAEVAAARSVQSLLIPTELPSNKYFMLESAYFPVNGVGGDFFQVLPLQDESLLLVVGDVSGKGLQAAMNSSTLVGALRNELSHDPATILRHLNRVLIGAVSSHGAVPELDAAPCFATCLCARIYPHGMVTIANAGHLSPYRDGREVEILPSLPLGVIADADYEQFSFQLKRGDRLVFLSDGVVEAVNAHGELFGFDRTQQVAHESARYIASAAQHFGQSDDITVVSIYCASLSAAHAAAEPVSAN